MNKATNATNSTPACATIRGSRTLLLGDETSERGLTLSPSQRACVGSKIRVALAWIKQGDLAMAGHVFAGLLDELSRDFAGDHAGGAKHDETHVSQLGLGQREANALERHDVFTAGELRAKLSSQQGRRWLTALPNFGPVVLANLFTALERHDARRRQSP